MGTKQKAKITAKRYGKSFVVIIEDEGNQRKLTRVTTTEEAEEGKRLIDIYTKMKRKGDLTAIEDFMQPKKKEAEEKKIKEKGLRKAIKKKEKELEEKTADEPKTGKELVTQVEDALNSKALSEEEVERLRKLLEVKKEEKKYEAPAQNTYTPRRGER